MANIFDKFLDSMKLYDDDEEEEEDLSFEETDETVYPEEEEEEPEQEKESTLRRFVRPSKKAAAPEPEEDKAEKSSIFGSARKSSNVTPIRSAAQAPASLEVSMIKPTTMNDARDIVDMLLAGRAVVINMEGVQVDLAQRIIDFSSGSCYSLDGNLQRISSYIFIITPSNVELSGDFQNNLGAGIFGMDRE